jgi:hypothetical protein
MLRIFILKIEPYDAKRAKSRDGDGGGTFVGFRVFQINSHASVTYRTGSAAARRPRVKPAHRSPERG